MLSQYIYTNNPDLVLFYYRTEESDKTDKTELESTFKEDISVYFDINPHDGLLETYSVDKSLEGKLKSIIFIPIISRTYCDPKSFAWQHEFVAFNKLAMNHRGYTKKCEKTVQII